MRGPRPGLLLALSVLTVAAAYSSALDVGFMWDDHTLIEENPAAHSLWPLSGFWQRSFWAHPFAEGTEQGYFRPLVALSFAVDWQLGGGSPLPFHVTNLFAHLVACALVMALAMRLGASSSASAAMATGFGLFPRLTESVVWVVGRTDVFATVFGLLALWLEAKSPGSLRRRVAVAAALLVGLFCKEVTLAVAVAIGAWSLTRVMRRQVKWRAEATAGLPILAVLLLYVALRTSSGTSRPMRLNSFEAMLNSLGHLIRLGLTPWFPNAQYGYAGALDGWAIALGALFLVASIIALRRGVWLAAGVATGLLLVSVPSLGLLTSASDRYLYLPLALGAAGAAGTISSPLEQWGRLSLATRAGLIGLALTVVSFGPVTYLRAQLWGHEARFWAETVAHAHPANIGPRNAYADALVDAHRVDEALGVYRSLLEHGAAPMTRVIELSVAVCLSIRGDDAEAIAALDRLDQSKKRVAFDRALFRARALDFAGARAALAPLEKQFGRDDALTKLETVVREAEQEWDAAATPSARARVFDGIGALGHAEARYDQVLASGSSTPQERQAALAWLVIKGPLLRADAALAQLAAGGTDSATLSGLREIMADRR